MYPLRSLVFLLLFGVVFPAFSQQDFTDGFIVDAENNYTYGFVAFTDTPHVSCMFKESKDGIASTYTTGQITGYGIINGKRFRKKPIENLNGKSFSEEIFMEAVVHGAISLYVAFDRMFIERGSSFYEIKIEKEKDKQQTYRKTMTSLLSDCDRVARKAKNIAITIFSIKGLIEEYNACAASGDQSTVLPRAAKALSVFAGFDQMTFSMEGATALTLNNQKFTDRTLATGGISYKFAPKRSRHLAYVTGLSFNDQRLYLSGQTPRNGQSVVETVRINYKVLRVPLQIEIGNFLPTRIQPYIRAGISIPITFQRYLTLDRESEEGNVIYIDQYDVTQKFKEPFLLLVIAGASIPVWNQVRTLCEVSYARGKNEFKLEAPQTITGKFRNIGFNIGLVYSF